MLGLVFELKQVLITLSHCNKAFENITIPPNDIHARRAPLNEIKTSSLIRLHIHKSSKLCQPGSHHRFSCCCTRLPRCVGVLNRLAAYYFPS